MRMRYDPESGALYFRLVEGEIEETLDLPSPGGYMDVGAEGDVMGLEFLSIQEFVMFLSGFGGEVETPERVDPDAYADAVRRAFEESHEAEAAGDVVQFFRETFRPRPDRKRTHRP